MRITDPRTFNSKLVTELQIDALSGALTTNYETFVKNSLKGSAGADAPVSYGYAYLNAGGTVDPALLPPLAINDTHTIEATNADTSSLELVKKAIGSNAVQRGDVVIVYGAPDITVENAEKLCGTFIFVAEVDAAANITADSYKNIYTPAGGVKTVNGIAAVNGNVALEAKDIPYLEGNVATTLADHNTHLTNIDTDLTVIKGSAETSGSMQYFAKQAETTAKGYTDEQIAAVKAIQKFVKVEALTPKPADPVEGTLYYTEAGQCAIYAASTWVDISEEIITEIATDTANDDKLATIGAIKSYITTNVTSLLNTELPKKADKVSGAVDGHLAALDANGNLKDAGFAVSEDAALSGTAVVPTAEAVKTYVDDKVITGVAPDITDIKKKAIQITSVTHTWTDAEKAGQIYTWTTHGRVIQVCDENGWVFPGVQFGGTETAITSTITVAMETAEGTVTGETWTYYIASTLA